MQGMKNGTECTLSRENETLPGTKPDSERNRYDPLRHGETSPPLPPTPQGRPRKRRRKKHRPPVQEVSVVHLHGGTRFPHTESAPAATMSYTMQFSWLAPRGQTSLLVCSLPSHGLTHNGGLSSRRLSPLRCILALTVPVVRGLATPFLLCRRLARGGLYGRRRHWINRLFIYLSATLYYRNWQLSTLLPTPMPRPGSSLR